MASYVPYLPDALPLDETAEIFLKIGESVLIEGKGFGGSGYLRTASVVNQAIAGVVKHSFRWEVPRGEDGEMVIGSSPPEAFAITGLGIGETDILFRLGRPWMQGNPGDDAEERRIRVKVA